MTLNAAEHHAMYVAHGKHAQTLHKAPCPMKFNTSSLLVKKDDQAGHDKCHDMRAHVACAILPLFGPVALSP